MLITFATYEALEDLTVKLNDYKGRLATALDLKVELEDELNKAVSGDEDVDLADIRDMKKKLNNCKLEIKSCEANIKAIHTDMAKSVLAEHFIEENPEKAKKLDKAPERKANEMIGWTRVKQAKAEKDAEKTVEELKSDVEGDYKTISDIKTKKSTKEKEAKYKKASIGWKSKLRDALETIHDIEWEEKHNDELDIKTKIELRSQKSEARKIVDEAEEFYGDKFAKIKKELMAEITANDDLKDQKISDTKKASNKVIESKIMSKLAQISNIQMRLDKLESDPDIDAMVTAKLYSQINALNNEIDELKEKSTDKQLDKKIDLKREDLGIYEEANRTNISKAANKAASKNSSKAIDQAESLAKELARAEFEEDHAESASKRRRAQDDVDIAKTAWRKFKAAHPEMDLQTILDDARDAISSRYESDNTFNDEMEDSNITDEFVKMYKDGEIYTVKNSDGKFYGVDGKWVESLSNAVLYPNKGAAKNKAAKVKGEPVEAPYNKFMKQSKIESMFENLDYEGNDTITPSKSTGGKDTVDNDFDFDLNKLVAESLAKLN